MPKIRSFILLLVVYFMLSGCNELSSIKQNISKNDSLVLKTAFHPAFEENSETKLLKRDSSQTIQILIKDNFRADKSEDTFWFKKIDLTNKQYSILDSSLIKICKQKIPKKEYHILDGMPIESLLIINGDTNIISYHSPSQKNDSIGYHFTKSLLDILDKTFHDTLVHDYLYDLEAYIDESKWHRPDSTRKIDKLRMRKYNWSIGK